MAWERPDQFRKVFSTVGSFVNLRGGHDYPALIRKTERKPIRVFLQDSTGDNDNPFGHWPTANKLMHAALRIGALCTTRLYGAPGRTALMAARRWPRMESRSSTSRSLICPKSAACLDGEIRIAYGERTGAKELVELGSGTAAKTRVLLDEQGRIDRSHVRLFAEGVPPAVPMTAATRSQIRTGAESSGTTPSTSSTRNMA